LEVGKDIGGLRTITSFVTPWVTNSTDMYGNGDVYTIKDKDIGSYLANSVLNGLTSAATAHLTDKIPFSTRQQNILKYGGENYIQEYLNTKIRGGYPSDLNPVVYPLGNPTLQPHYPKIPGPYDPNRYRNSKKRRYGR
jgi:hypothetical protein